MAVPKLSISSSQIPMHYSVGALIKQDDSYLLIDRAVEPFGFACVAGHIDEGETEVEALVREVKEESGLTVVSSKLLFEEEVHDNKCSKGINVHYWYLYECEVTGSFIENVRETKSIGWYTLDEIKKLRLEPVWKYWFEKMKLL